MRNGEYILVVAPDDYIGKRYRDRYCYEHHLVYWENHRIILKEGEVIHHIDGNKHNNSIENLEIQSRSEHARCHNNLKERKYVVLKCPICRSIFERPHNKTHLCKKTRATCCSRKCGYLIGQISDIQHLIEDHVICEYRRLSY